VHEYTRHERTALMSIMNSDQLRQVLKSCGRNEFLSPHGIRALSRVHKDTPYVLAAGGGEYRVDYEPANRAPGLSAAIRTGVDPSGPGELSAHRVTAESLSLSR